MKSMLEGLVIRRFVNRGRTGSIPVSGTMYPCAFKRSPSSGGLFCAPFSVAQNIGGLARFVLYIKKIK